MSDFFTILSPGLAQQFSILTAYQNHLERFKKCRCLGSTTNLLNECSSLPGGCNMWPWLRTTDSSRPWVPLGSRPRAIFSGPGSLARTLLPLLVWIQCLI